MKKQETGRHLHGGFTTIFQAMLIWSFIPSTLHLIYHGMKNQKNIFIAMLIPKLRAAQRAKERAEAHGLKVLVYKKEQPNSVQSIDSVKSDSHD